MRRWRETGRIDPRPRGGFRHGKLGAHRDFILAVVAAHHDITMPELAEELSKPKVSRLIHQPFRSSCLPQASASQKILRASEQDRPELARARAEWRDSRQPIMRRERYRLIFIDETGTTTKMTRLRGRSAKGAD